MASPTMRSFCMRNIITTSAPLNASSKFSKTLAFLANCCRGRKSAGPASRNSPTPRRGKSARQDRATRECLISPASTILSLLKSPKCCFRVTASSKAWVGCAPVPSPALMTCVPARARSASCCAVPSTSWRITRKSGCMACKASYVSSRDSPFSTELPCAAIFTT